MKRIILLVLMISSFIPLGASDVFLSSSKNSSITSGNEICSNVTYEINTNSEIEKEILLVNGDNNLLLETINSNSETFDIDIPNNITNLVLYITDYNNNVLEKDSTVSVNYVVKDCGYESTSTNNINFHLSSTLEDNTLTFTLNDENYEFNYKIVGEKNFKKFKFNEEKQFKLNVEENKAIQIAQKNLSDGIIDFFEVDIRGKDIIIRPINDQELNVISFSKIVDKKLIIALLVLIVLFIFFHIKYLRSVNAYKRYKKRMASQNKR